MRIEPLSGHVVVRKLHGETESPGGIILPDSAKKESVAAVVLHTPDPWIDDNGIERSSRLRRGDAVIISKYAGESFRLGRTEFTILKESAIFGVLHEFIPQDSSPIPAVATVRQEADAAGLWGDGIEETEVPIEAGTA